MPLAKRKPRSVKASPLIDPDIVAMGEAYKALSRIKDTESRDAALKWIGERLTADYERDQRREKERNTPP